MRICLKGLQMKKGDKNQEIIHLNPVIELDEEDRQLPAILAGKRKTRKKLLKRVGIGGAVLVIVAVAVLVYFQNIVYTAYSVTKTYGENMDGQSEYHTFGSGILKYGKNGVTHMSKEGKTNWNHGYQMTNPIVVTTEESAAIGNIGGNEIITIDDTGVKGEIETNLPILNLAVSEQGIVAAILESEKGAEVVCYDAVGTILVEHTPTLMSSGVPTDVALSKDGTTMIVTYLKIEGTNMVGRYAYYNLGSGDLESDKTVIEKEFPDEIVAKAFFVNEEISGVISDTKLSLYQMGDEEALEIELEQPVELVFHDESNIGVLLRNIDSEGSELRIYNALGGVVSTTQVLGEYTQAVFQDGQVILYEGANCMILTSAGRQLYEGNLENNIMLISPDFGVGRYTVINTEGIQEVQLKR